VKLSAGASSKQSGIALLTAADLLRSGFFDLLHHSVKDSLFLTAAVIL
jgi:hypothetical protein